MGQNIEGRDLYDWARIGLMGGYIGILASLVILALIEPVYFIFNLLVLVWVIPFVIIMVIGETTTIKRFSWGFWVALVGLAVIVGIYFGWARFFYTEGIVFGILSTALYAIIIAYIALRYADSDGRGLTLLLLFIILITGTALFALAAGFDFYGIYMIIIPILQFVAIICFAVSLTIVMFLFVNALKTR